VVSGDVEAQRQASKNGDTWEQELGPMSLLLSVIAGVAATLAALISLLRSPPVHRFAALRLVLVAAILLCGTELLLSFSERKFLALIPLLIAGALIAWAGDRILRQAPGFSDANERWLFVVKALLVFSGACWTASAALQLAE
jgi:hypothetical protein